MREWDEEADHQPEDIMVRERGFEPVPADVEVVAKDVVDAAFSVHKALGPGLLESVYETCLLHELKKRGRKVATQVPVPVVYDGLRLDAGLRLDMLVEDRLIVEIKSVERMNPPETGLAHQLQRQHDQAGHQPSHPLILFVS
jgi:GxxExxY protein